MAKKKAADETGHEVVIDAEVIEAEDDGGGQMVAQKNTLAAKGISPMTLLEKAMADGSGASVEQLERLYELQVKYEANEARKAYHAAIAKFKASNIRILKKGNVDFTNKQGQRVNYDYDTLGHVIDQIIEPMSECGLSHSWSMSQQDGLIEVTCKITHEMGHSETVAMKAGADDSGGKNKIQQIASTNTYLQRYTLRAALGLAAHDDDDGRGADVDEEDQEPVINECQLADLEALADEVKADVDKFCEHMATALKLNGLDCLAKLPAKHLKYACELLERKRAAQ